MGEPAVSSGMRVSTIAPVVQKRLNQVNELVQLMQSGGAGLTDTQSQRLVGYLGNLEEMRDQVGTMAQRYQDNVEALGTLTLLLDSIDEALVVLQNSSIGVARLTQREQEEEERKIVAELAKKKPTLLVSTVGLLGISGLPRLFAVAPEVNGSDEEEEEEDDDEDEDDSGDEKWNPPLSASDMSSIAETSETGEVPRNLSQSFMEPLDGATLRLSIVDDAGASSSKPPEASSSAANSKKNKKGKQKSRGPCDPTLCKICYEEFTTWDQLHKLSKCGHIYCNECLEGYLTVNITNGGVLDLCCPDPTCEAEIDESDISAVCPPEIVDKYEKFCVLASLRANPNVRWCPMPRCSAPITGPPTDGSPWVTCENCHLQVCFACGDERHDPATCGEEARELISKRRDVVVQAEAAFEKWHQGRPNGVKPCPQCHAFIEKNQGCNHMTCVACKHQFCWLCSKSYTSIHFNSDTFPDCKGKQYWVPPTPPDPELAARYNWIYFPPNYQYQGVDGETPLAPPRRNPFSNVHVPLPNRRQMKKVGVYVGLGVAVVTLGVPAAVIGGPIYGVFRLHRRMKIRRRMTRASFDLTDSPLYHE